MVSVKYFQNNDLTKEWGLYQGRLNGNNSTIGSGGGGGGVLS